MLWSKLANSIFQLVLDFKIHSYAPPRDHRKITRFLQGGAQDLPGKGFV